MPDPRTGRPPAVLVILGHPRGPASLCGALADAYADGARAAGCTVETVDLSALRFEPDVVEPSPRGQPLEPDLQALKAAVERADHLALVYPNWWGTMPALLKGALDRLLVPGWAFEETTGGIGFEGRLGPRTAEILTTMDTPPLAYRLFYGSPGRRAMADATLGFCGIEATRFTPFAVVKDTGPERRRDWIAGARRLGEDLARGPRPPLHAARRAAGSWLRALRLQFYPMTLAAYAVGALLAAPAGGFDGTAFWLGYAMLFLLEAATVFANDLFDRDSDRRNRHYGPFSGGSRVLVDGRLTAGALGRGAVLAGLGAAALLGVLALRGVPPPALAVVLLLAVLALGYTVPPLKLCHRGLGELDVALTHSFGVIYAGYALQGAALGNPAPALVAAPLFLAVLPAILLAGIPDHAADRASGKRTLVVILGIDGAFLAAAALALAAAGSAAVLFGAADVRTLAGVALVAPLHAAWLLYAVLKTRRRVRSAARIDGLLVNALLYIVWFAALPLVWLLA